MLIVVFAVTLTAYQGIVNSKSRCLSPDRRSALARDMLNALRSERLMGGNDRVGLVRVELVLGGQCAFAGCGEGGRRRSGGSGTNVG